MPPLPSWYQGRAAIGAFLAGFVFEKKANELWHVEITRANGQPAMALYLSANEPINYRIFGLEVFTFEQDKIARIDMFMTGNAFPAAHVETPWLSHFNLRTIMDSV
jgi:RNA polymerase sigma-70 factor (ECF subfamily)